VRGRSGDTIRNNELRIACCIDDVSKAMIVGLDGSFLREPHARILAKTLARYNRSISHRLARRGTLGPVVERSNRKVLHVLACSCGKCPPRPADMSRAGAGSHSSPRDPALYTLEGMRGCFFISARVRREDRLDPSSERLLPFLEAYRTMCCAPDQEFRRVLEQGREMRVAA